MALEPVISRYLGFISEGEGMGFCREPVIHSTESVRAGSAGDHTESRVRGKDFGDPAHGLPSFLLLSLCVEEEEVPAGSEPQWTGAQGTLADSGLHHKPGNSIPVTQPCNELLIRLAVEAG